MAEARSGNAAKRGIDRENYATMYIHGVANKLSRGASRIFLKNYGVGVIEWRILAILAVEADVTASNICQAINLDKAAASRSIKLLEGEGYITSRPKMDGTRNRILELTRKGQKLHDNLLPIAESREAQLLEGFSTTERKQLLGMLKRLQRNAIKLNDGDV